MTEQVTGEQVKATMMAANIDRVEHHACSFCGYRTAYVRSGADLRFDPGCYCTHGRPPEPRSWDDAADWINMQNAEHRPRLLRAFGFEVPA